MAKGPGEKFCSSCGQVIESLAEICPHCGVRQMNPPSGGESAALPMILNGVLGIFGFLGSAISSPGPQVGASCCC